MSKSRASRTFSKNVWLVPPSTTETQPEPEEDRSQYGEVPADPIPVVILDEYASRQTPEEPKKPSPEPAPLSDACDEIAMARIVGESCIFRNDQYSGARHLRNSYSIRASRGEARYRGAIPGNSRQCAPRSLVETQKLAIDRQRLTAVLLTGFCRGCGRLVDAAISRDELVEAPANEQE